MKEEMVAVRILAILLKGSNDPRHCLKSEGERP